MYPAYPWTNSYPMHFAPNDDPRAKEIPFHMKMDPNTPMNPSYHQPWPYYPAPHEYPGCCNHSYFGGGPYSFRPPYPHYPPPPPTLYNHGFYPPFPGAYPAYSTPPPHYSVEQPRYDYDKGNHVPHHCCGYGHQEDEKKSRIVREEPRVEKKTSESLVPLFLKDSPYPIMWVPPSGNMNTGSKAKENERRSRLEREEPEVDKKTSESLVPLFSKDSPYPIMWVPPSGNVNNESKAKENKKKSRMEREEPEVDKKTNESLVPLFLKDSPYPIMWVPPSENMNTKSKAKENEKKLRMERVEPEVDKKTSESLVPLFLKDSPYPIMWVPPARSMNEESKAKDKEKHSQDPVSSQRPRKQEEREEPEVDKKTSESLIPLFLKDSPYPIMWVPPARNMNEESKAKDKEKHSQDPVSLKDAEPIKQGENGEGNHLPFPIFWLPSKNNEVGNETKDNNLDRVAHKRLPDENKRQGSDSEAVSETGNKHVVQKVIPVKQVGANEEKKSIETKMKPDSVEKTDNGVEEGKASPKTSKLPPVCLRIDPLPRKKKTSRSPSPPGVKDRSKSGRQDTQLPENLKKEEERSKGNIKTNAVSDAKKVEKNSLADLCENVPKGEIRKVEEKKNLSEQEAALMIQSAYRGFEVRKSQPLTKLRQLREVTKQVVEIRNRIQDMESSSSAIRIDDKQKLIIGETIMSLLLKLDTIQGLHPIVRDVRKSVAKELVGLQGKLDSLTSIKSGTPVEENVSSNKQDMHLEDDTIEEKSDSDSNVTSNVTTVEAGSGLSGNYEVDAKESHDDGGAEAYNTNIEPQSELCKEENVGELNNEQPLDNVIQPKFDQAPTQFDRTNEAIDAVANSGVEGFDIKPEQLVEHNTGELYDNQIQISVETDQPLDSIDQEKSDHVQVESDSTHEDAGLNTVLFENHEVEAIDSVDNNGEGARDTKTEQLIEQNTGEINSDKHVETEQPSDDSIQEKSHELLVESGTIAETMKSDTDVCEHHEVESAESYNDAAEAGDLRFEQQVESESQQSITELTNKIEIPETEQTVKQEKPVQAEAQFESVIENVESAAESDDISFEQQVESESQQSITELTNKIEIPETEQTVQQEKPVQAEAQFESVIENVESAEDSNMEDRESEDVSVVEINVDLSKENTVKGIQEDLVVPTEEAPKADDVEMLMEDLGETPPASPRWRHVTGDGDGKQMENLQAVRSELPMSGGDRKLMEENEKLRVAVEELLKAGNEQLGVIRELTGKVKDLEKKLTKKNKKIKVNKCRSRDFVVQDELSDCLV